MNEIKIKRILMFFLTSFWVILTIFISFFFIKMSNYSFPINGEWHCESLASDGVTDTSFYALYIKDDYLSIYDQAAGNPGISGKITEIKKDSIVVKFNKDDFDTPLCWQLKNTDELKYAITKNTIVLTHNDISMTFIK